MRSDRRVPEELQTEVTEVVKKCKKAKSLSEQALQIAEKRREAKGKGEKERYTHLNAVSKTSKKR